MKNHFSFKNKRGRIEWAERLTPRVPDTREKGNREKGISRGVGEKGRNRRGRAGGGGVTEKRGGGKELEQSSYSEKI